MNAILKWMNNVTRGIFSCDSDNHNNDNEILRMKENYGGSVSKWYGSAKAQRIAATKPFTHRDAWCICDRKRNYVWDLQNEMNHSMSFELNWWDKQFQFIWYVCRLLFWFVYFLGDLLCVPIGFALFCFASLYLYITLFALRRQSY